jgi:hypothetical protein
MDCTLKNIFIFIFTLTGLSFYKEDEKRKEQTTGETKNLARFLVQYDLVRVVPFASVKKYMFTNNTWRV